MESRRRVRVGGGSFARAASSTTLALALLAAACTADDDARTLSVFAASSLTEAFTELERAFEAAHPGVDVRTTFAGTQVLRLQLEQGARADLFASADRRHVEALRDKGLLTAITPFARGQLVIIVPATGDSPVTDLQSLPRAKRLVVGTPQVPVGHYFRKLLRRIGERRSPQLARAIEARIASEESNARLVRAKVELGEADAAIVYRTDAMATDRVKTIPIPDDLAVAARYHIATTKGARAPTLAHQFTELLRSNRGRTILARHGFTPQP
ncbi:MAG: molybdate ABC transporter substrate-binding protein [Myxococcales bacterium]